MFKQVWHCSRFVVGWALLRGLGVLVVQSYALLFELCKSLGRKVKIRRVLLLVAECKYYWYPKEDILLRQSKYYFPDDVSISSLKRDSFNVFNFCKPQKAHKCAMFFAKYVLATIHRTTNNDIILQNATTTLQKLMKMPFIIQEKHLFQQRKLNFVREGFVNWKKNKYLYGRKYL